MNIVIIGAKGQLGIDLMARARHHGWHAVGADLPDCDITRPDTLEPVFEQAAPVAAVINAAAYTAVDRAESDADTAYAVNRDGPGYLAQWCSRLGVPLVHVSTDYVFGGLQTRPYQPSDPLGPLGVYGKSKAAGEAAVRNHCAQHVIVRTSWLFGLHGPNFVKTMLRLGKEQEVLRVVDDQIGSPTYAADLADALLTVAAHVVQHQSGWGTHHFCNAGALTWYAFTRKIFALARPYSHFKVNEVRAILAANYPTPAPRPYYSVLDCTSFENTFAGARRPWQEALKEMLAQLYASIA
jgi:dTDP-4-dehydrorhamnose reductase